MDLARTFRTRLNASFNNIISLTKLSENSPIFLIN